MNTYKMRDFMRYPNMALDLAMIKPFTWANEIVVSAHLNRGIKWILIKIWFVFGAVNLIYQSFGMMTFLLMPQLAIFSHDIEDGGKNISNRWYNGSNSCGSC